MNETRKKNTNQQESKRRERVFNWNAAINGSVSVIQLKKKPNYLYFSYCNRNRQNTNTTISKLSSIDTEWFLNGIFLSLRHMYANGAHCTAQCTGKCGNSDSKKQNDYYCHKFVHVCTQREMKRQSMVLSLLLSCFRSTLPLNSPFWQIKSTHKTKLNGKWIHIRSIYVADFLTVSLSVSHTKKGVAGLCKIHRKTHSRAHIHASTI